MKPANVPSGFAVILTDRGARDPLVLGKALAAARKTPVQDQMIAARNSWGIVAQGLTEEEAKALVSALLASEVESVARPGSMLVQLPGVEPATNLESSRAGPPILIAAAGITLNSETTSTEKRDPTGAQKMVSTMITLGTGLPIKIGGRTRTVETTRQQQDLVFHADVVYEKPWRRLRIAAAKFDYSCLGPRKLYQAQGNLKLLLGDLVKGAPEAWQNHGTHVLLEGKPIQTMGYASLGDLEREATWLLTLRAMGS